MHAPAICEIAGPVDHDVMIPAIIDKVGRREGLPARRIKPTLREIRRRWEPPAEQQIQTAAPMSPVGKADYGEAADT